MSENNMTLPDLGFQVLSPFWKACKKEELRFPYCSICESWQWYPLFSCPSCGGEYNWEKVSGEGTLFSWTVVRKPPFPEFAEKVPYIVGVIDMEGARGVRFISTIEGCEPNQLQIGMKVSLFFDQINSEVSLPKFTIGSFS
jgi:uncharacterized protein